LIFIFFQFTKKKLKNLNHLNFLKFLNIKKHLFEKTETHHSLALVGFRFFQMESFYKIESHVLISREKRNFSQIIGEHAIHLTELTKADAKNSKRNLMNTWAQIHKLCDEWANLVCQNEKQGSEFTKNTTKLIHMYSEALGDYILDKANGEEWQQKISSIVDLEAKFFKAISQNQSKKQWVAYTNSVIGMVNAAVRYGHESETFYSNASVCVKDGVLLGQWLDGSLFK
jgi:hypothetical protein